MHVTEGTLQAYLDDELAAADRESVASHLAVCSACTSELTLLESASGHLAALLAGADLPAPEVAPDPFTRARWSRRAIGARRTLSRAAVLLVFAAGAVAAAVPGSPLHEALKELWSGAAARFSSAPAPAAPAPEPEPAPAAGADRVSSVSVEPLGGSVSYTIVDAGPATRVHVRLVDGPIGGVEARGEASQARFRTGPGRIEVRRIPSGDLTVLIPRGAQSATVRVDGRTLLSKEGDHLRLLAAPADSSAEEIVFEVGG